MELKNHTKNIWELCSAADSANYLEILTCVWELPGSNFDRATVYPDISSGFSQFLQTNIWIISFTLHSTAAIHSVTAMQQQ
jgi:hypothetical protein